MLNSNFSMGCTSRFYPSDRPRDVPGLTRPGERGFFCCFGVPVSGFLTYQNAFAVAPVKLRPGRPGTLEVSSPRKSSGGRRIKYPRGCGITTLSYPMHDSELTPSSVLQEAEPVSLLLGIVVRRRNKAATIGHGVGPVPDGLGCLQWEFPPCLTPHSSPMVALAHPARKHKMARLSLGLSLDHILVP